VGSQKLQHFGGAFFVSTISQACWTIEKKSLSLVESTFIGVSTQDPSGMASDIKRGELIGYFFQ